MRRDDVLGVTGAATLIGSGVIVTGNLASDSDMSVDGTLTGNITCNGDVIIGVNGLMKGHVKANNVMVLGSISGNIVASDDVAIRETGNVHGNITAGGLTIFSGGVFVGTSKLNQSDLPVRGEEQP